jgi:hypothetical protein
MGPVSGMGYGTAVCDWQMVKRSVRNETGSLGVCILIGAIIGGCTGWTNLSENWPSTYASVSDTVFCNQFMSNTAFVSFVATAQEMTTRGELDNFLVGLPVAFFRSVNRLT